MWILKWMERLKRWSDARLMRRHFPRLTADQLTDMIMAIDRKERDSDEWAEAFLTSRTFAEIRCVCGVTYIAGDTLTPRQHEHYREVRRQGGSVEVHDGVERIYTVKVDNELRVLRCPCLRAKMARHEKFVRDNRAAIEEYLARTNEGEVDPPTKGVNRLKRETNETD